MSVKATRRGKAIFMDEKYGPVFGAGDLVIVELKPGLGKKILTGDDNSIFQVSEYEVLALR